MAEAEKEREIALKIVRQVCSQRYPEGRVGLHISSKAVVTVIDCLPAELISVDLINKDGHVPLIAFIRFNLWHEDEEELMAIREISQRWDFVRKRVVERLIENAPHDYPSRILLGEIRGKLTGRYMVWDPESKIAKEFNQLGLFDSVDGGFTIPPIVVETFGAIIQ